MRQRVDVVIVGGGITGLTLSCALAKQTDLSIVILEASAEDTPFFSETTYHHRVSAITLCSQRIFNALGVWEAIANTRVSPFNCIQVWDADEHEMLQFTSKEINELLLGHIIENNVMQAALLKKIQQYPQIDYIAPATLADFIVEDETITITTSEGRSWQTGLAVAADGARSWLRTQAGIHVDKKHYQQAAIVTTVKTEQSHEKTARQVFLPTGPLAFLPLLDDKHCSIVWSLNMADAESNMQLSDEAFCTVLARAFAYRLGNITQVEKRYVFPLTKQKVNCYIKPHIALIGDAAHIVHPLAGQGVNMGLLDAASLAEVITDAHLDRRQYNSLSVLRRYERWRKADNLAMFAGIDVIKNTFASEHPSLIHLRQLGVQLINETGWLKSFFTRQAVGNRNGLPRLASLL